MWVANKDILVTDLGDELVLLHPAQSEMFSLNASGRLIWQALPATLEELSRQLAEEYGLGPEQAAADVQAVLSALQARDLVSLSAENS